MIKIEKIYKEIAEEKGFRQVLNGIDLEIHEGEKVVIVGPSGAGKSTLLRCINLLESFSSGDILFHEKSILNINPPLLRRKIGMIFQHFNLFSHMTVKKNITFAPVKLKLCSKKQASERAFSLLKEVGLESKSHAFPSCLSGGEKQRVAIARALAMNPEILLLDEPTSALDPKTVVEVTEVLKNLANDITIIAVTHDMSFAKSIASRLVFMENGKIVEDGSIEEVFSGSGYTKTRSFFRE